MRRLSAFFALVFFANNINAQFNHYDGYKGAVKSGFSYVHDFPGVKGAAVYVEYVAPFNEWLEGSFGIKRLQTSGFPRTASIREFTRATTIDFNLLVVPFSTETTALKLGLGYTCSMYHARRASSQYDKNIPATIHSEPVWETTDLKGRSKGMTLTAEYEYFLSNNLSFGAKIQYTKGYQYVITGGPFAAIRL